ncbi:MAG: FeoB small GTPase domain-containing protein, partial [Thermoanaerobaculia bacterium]
MTVASPPTKPSAAGAVRPAPRRAGARRLLLLGNPNTGKTTLFNRLCGMRAKTANFPGTTTDLRVGRLQLPASAGSGRAGSSGAGEAFDVVDLPGVYSLELDLPESKVAAMAVAGHEGIRPAGAIVVADATNLSRHLMLVGELARQSVPFVVALNMIDLAHRRGLSFDLEKMSRAIGAPVIAITARSGKGIEELLAVLPEICAGDAAPRGAPAPEARAEVSAVELELWAENVVAESVGGAHAVGSGSDTLLDRLDKTFTHPIAGLVIFHLVMAGLFWAIFALASLPMDLIEATFSRL